MKNKYIKTFETFNEVNSNEAINLNLTKELSKDWDKTQLDDIFGKNIYMTIYKWVKTQIKSVRGIEPIGTRIKILEANKKKLRLVEYQNLFEYWKFADTYYGQFRLANLELDAYKRVIIDWVWYLTMIQLFPDELKNCKLQDGRSQDFYTDSYNEILALPKLSGDLESDKKILEDVAYNNFYNPKSVVRQDIILYEIIFKKNILF